jgi:hypothetical protein
LETLFGRPVDLVTGSGLANPYFRARITAERRNVYARRDFPGSSRSGTF